MFEITYSDSEIFEDYQNAGKANAGGTYDFTFESRYLIYHAALRREVNYIAIDMATGLASLVITKAPGNLYTEASYCKLIPHILYSVKYTGDVRYLNRFADNPMEVMKIKRNYGIPVTGSFLLTAVTAIKKGSKSTIWLDMDENGVLSLCSTPKDDYPDAEEREVLRRCHPAKNHHHRPDLQETKSKRG